MCRSKYLGGLLLAMGVLSGAGMARGDTVPYSIVALPMPAGYSVNANARAAPFGRISDNGMVASTLMHDGDSHAFRWDAGAGTYAQLNQVGATHAGSSALGINNSGIAVGAASNGTNNVAAQWPAGSSTPVQLSGLSTGASSATAINDSGLRVGYSRKISTDGFSNRAVRWNSSNTAIELPVLGQAGSGRQSWAYDVDSAGTIVGRAEKYANGTLVNEQAVVWAADTNQITELPGYAAPPETRTDYIAYAINASGVIVGRGYNFTTTSTLRGQRALRWDPGATAPVILPSLGNQANHTTIAIAHDINDAGVIVGYAERYVQANPSGDNAAVLWTAAGEIIQLNSLLAADSGWDLRYATSINNSGQIFGAGMFDPDGAGPKAAESRFFVLTPPPPPPTPTVPLPLAAYAGGAMLAAMAVARKRRRTHG